MNSICSLVPVSLDSECFEEGDRMDLVTSAEKFRNVFNATGLPRTARRRRSSDSAKAQRQKQWGDPHCLSEFASLGQHSACLHILFCINSVVYKFAKSSLICKANNAVQCGRDNGEVLLKVLLN